MRRVTHTTEITVSLEQTWSVLSDLDRWADWNPTIISVDGRLELQAPITIHVAKASGRNSWATTMSLVTPGREFAWSFHEIAPVLYRGEHSFRLEAAGGHSTRFIDTETFWGILAPLRSKDHVRIATGMVQMGEALKAYVERGD